MRLSVISGAVVCLLIGAADLGCGKSEPTAATSVVPAETHAFPSVIVQPAWLREHATHAPLILDTRPREQYDASHVHGAVSLPSTDISVFSTEGKRSMAALDVIQRRFSEAGVDLHRPVLVYDDGDHRASSFVFWILEVHGHHNAAVLNGGFPGCKEAGVAVDTQKVASAPTNFVANIQPQLLATKLTVSRALGDPNFVLVDARAPEEYSGEKRVAARAGHIPGAINLHAVSALDGSGTACHVKSSDELKQLYAQVPAGKKVIVYCNYGKKVPISYLTLRSLGREVAIYDGAWTEWAADSALPVETGAKTAQLDSK